MFSSVCSCQGCFIIHQTQQSIVKWNITYSIVREKLLLMCGIQAYIWHRLIWLQATETNMNILTKRVTHWKEIQELTGPGESKQPDLKLIRNSNYKSYQTLQVGTAAIRIKRQSFLLFWITLLKFQIPLKNRHWLNELRSQASIFLSWTKEDSSKVLGNKGWKDPFCFCSKKRKIFKSQNTFIYCLKITTS